MEIYRFSAELCDWTDKDEKTSKKVLGGKGAALVKMAQDGFNVPAGFTITTNVCNALTAIKDPLKYDAYLSQLMEAVEKHMEWLTQKFGYTPLVSVRSGAPVSMPGMMDTILNVGLTEDNFGEWVERLGFRAALDSQRRLIQMLGTTAYGVPMEVFDFQLAKVKKEAGVTLDTELGECWLEGLVENYQHTFQKSKGFEFPINNAKEQLRAAIKAVFSSWMNPRAIEYRKLNKIDESMGTAVNIQAMVFGNMGDDSGTGVLFTRDPSTGSEGTMGEFLQNAQGEDVVAGIRTPLPIEKMGALSPLWQSIRHQIEEVCVKLEKSYKDMVDIEFTVQKGELFILQSRSGKRSASAAFKIAVDLVNAGVIDQDTAMRRITRDQYKVMSRPMLDPTFKTEPDLVGLPACPGVVTGKPVFSSKDAINCKEPCILITHETTPDDIGGMNAAVGILTQTGGATSHAAVVARAMDTACVVGCTAMELQGHLIGKAGKMFSDQSKITIDGATGRVWVGIDVPVVDSSNDPNLALLVKWAYQKMGCLEGTATPLGKEHRSHGIQAAHWWDQPSVAKVVLQRLQEEGNLTNVALDIRPPRDFMPASDSALLGCFGNPTSKLFAKELVELLINASQHLQGLVVVCPSEEVATALSSHGYTTLTEAEIVPVDYAAFNVLAA